MCWLGYGSKLSALNAARKAAGQAEVDENDPCIYAMENKSGWRIDGGRWKEVCSLVGCLMVIRDIVSSSLKSYVEHHPNSKQDMQPIKIFKKWMLEWASNITLTYKQSEIKKQLDACLDCLAESKARSVDWWKAPDVLTDYLKEHYEPFHKFHFPDISEDSNGEEGGQTKKTSRSDDDTESEEEGRKDVQSDTEFDDQSAGLAYLHRFCAHNFSNKLYFTLVLCETVLCETGITMSKGQLANESPEKAGGSLSLSFCEYAGDEPDENSQSGFDLFLKTPGSKDLSLSNSLFGSPARQPSTSLSSFPLQTITEESCEGGQAEDILACLRESSAFLQGTTPQDVHSCAVKYGILKTSLEAVQLALVEYPKFREWEMKHEPLEKVVALREHPQQFEIFQSWVQLCENPRPTTAQTAVRVAGYEL